ncbi:hypothetical protein GGF46_003321 [Coemansia sp. RSA 552]|nr:hypothetical protein GGF46_003321 [Coemansia sp. RSA 552]
MVQRKSRRAAATAAKSAIAHDLSDSEKSRPTRARTTPTGKRTKKAEPAAAAAATPARRVGRPKGSKNKKQPATPVKAAAASEDEEDEEDAPPDTLLVSRRMRGRGAVSRAAPKPRRSPRAAETKAAETRVTETKAAETRGRKPRASKPAKAATSDAAEAEDEGKSDDGLDDTDLSDGAFPETPTRRRGAAAPTPLTLSEDTVVEIDKLPSPRSAKGGRGRKRKSDTLTAPVEASTAPPATPAKRGRPRKTQKTEGPSSPTRAKLQSDSAQPSNSGVYVDIVSPSKFETTRTRLRSAKQAEAPEAAAGETSGWRARYEELLELRQTQPEKEYDEFRAKAQERFDASEEVIKNLRAELAGLRVQPAPAPKEDAGEDSEQGARAAMEKDFERQLALLRQQVESLTQDVLAKDEALARLEKHRKLTETATDYNLRQKLKIMEEVTGLAINDLIAEDNGLSYVCAHAGPAATARYVLTVFDDLPNDYEYTPYEDPAAQSALPAYLREPISFDRSAANMFYWRVSNHLHGVATPGTPPTEPAEEAAPAPAA